MNRRQSIKPIALITITAALCGLAVLPFAGCATPTEDQCSKAKVAYELYQASLIDRTPSKEEIAAARIAAAYLTASCGWVQTKGADKYGVPIVKPPKAGK